MRGKPIQLTIRVRKLINEYNGSERAALINNLKTKGFKVKVMTWYLCGEKRINLHGVETLEDLRKVVKNRINKVKGKVPSIST